MTTILLSALRQQRCSAHSASNRPTPPFQTRAVSTLILLRHGQSQWNNPNPRFTGWVDIPLTVKGRVEAVGAGQLLRSRGFKASRVDVAFTSKLQRAHETCELALASMAGPHQHTWSSDRIRRLEGLNERHYGIVQGKKKNDPDVLNTYGNDTVRSWRRSLRGKPPPLDETHEHWMPPPAPTTESLLDCQRRVLGAFHDHIAPALFEEEGLPHHPDERAVVVVAHSNTIRSLMAAFDNVPDESVPKLHVPNSVPILYKFDTATRLPVSSKLQSAAGGSHARWLVSAENHREVRKAITGHTLIRGIFESLDIDNNRDLSAAEIDRGLREYLKEDEKLDCVTVAVAKKVAREMSPRETISLQSFEERALAAAQGLTAPHAKESYFDHDPGSMVLDEQFP
uniref:Phosphoglycerate mutase n=1 Tax=Grammatophora oceanica TaxID=210454 RepID=A0A7S1V3Z2_9STRA